jgi:hypothetical protein
MLSRDVQLRNFQTIAPPAMIGRPMGAANPMHAPGINLPDPSGERSPGTNYIQILTAPTPQPGMSDPRTAGTRTVPPTGSGTVLMGSGASLSSSTSSLGFLGL